MYFHEAEERGKTGTDVTHTWKICGSCLSLREVFKDQSEAAGETVSPWALFEVCVLGFSDWHC